MLDPRSQITWIATDQLGCFWLIRERDRQQWALGFDANGHPACRQVFDGRIVTDWSQPVAERILLLPWRALSLVD
jgi:hypothetical protein